jgi:hypothetical protein
MDHSFLINSQSVVKQSLRLFTKLSAIGIFLTAMAILIATSEADFPMADSEFVTVALEKEATEASFRFSYRNGPFDFDSFPLMIDIQIEHSELNEDFNFEGQSWIMTTASLEGEHFKTRTLFRRGNNEALSADLGKYTLRGTTGIYGCDTELESANADDTCIPCNADQETCSFKLTFIREGAPYPAEKVKIQASQWLSSEDSKVQLTVSAH